jgi:hypothetical protein
VPVVVGWRETEPCRRPPVEGVGGLSKPTTRGFCRKSSIAARSRNTSGAFRAEKEDPLTAESDVVLAGGDVKQQVVRGGREKKIRRPYVDVSGRQGS